MGYRTYMRLGIAVIGDNAVSAELTRAFARAGHDIFIANIGDNHQALPEKEYLPGNVYHCTIEQAAACADILFLATPPGNIREVAYWLGDVRSKIIIDISPNVGAGGESAAESINTVGAISAITGSSNILKVFNVFGQYRLFKPLFKGEKVDMIMAGDSRKAKELTRIVMKELNLDNCYDFGGSDTFPLFDEMARGWRKMINITNHPTGLKKAF